MGEPFKEITFILKQSTHCSPRGSRTLEHQKFETCQESEPTRAEKTSCLKRLTRNSQNESFSSSTNMYTAIPQIGNIFVV